MMKKTSFNKKIKLYEGIIDNINKLANNDETKYEVLNNTFHLINRLGEGKNLGLRKLGKQFRLMMYCEGQINLFSPAIKEELLDDGKIKE